MQFLCQKQSLFEPKYGVGGGGERKRRGENKGDVRLHSLDSSLFSPSFSPSYLSCLSFRDCVKSCVSVLWYPISAYRIKKRERREERRDKRREEKRREKREERREKREERRARRGQMRGTGRTRRKYRVNGVALIVQTDP